LDRADQISLPENRATVIAQSHKTEVEQKFGNRPMGILVEQPSNRDTAAGIFLPLTFVRARDPEATVVIYPSDHFIYPEGRFVQIVRNALGAAEELRDKAVILGAHPNSLELEYGWIKLGMQNVGLKGQASHLVEAFYEKPHVSLARSAMESGALWNTLIVAARVSLLWDLGWRYFPQIMRQFERLATAIDTPEEKSVLRSVYETLPSLNFASDLLTHATSHLAVMEMKDVLWCDWGKPERIVDTLRHIGKKPSFPFDLLPSYPERAERTSDVSVASPITV
jgi:mannose-1-phosphate guanylyltransferase